MIFRIKNKLLFGLFLLGLSCQKDTNSFKEPEQIETFIDKGIYITKDRYGLSGHYSRLIFSLDKELKTPLSTNENYFVSGGRCFYEEKKDSLYVYFPTDLPIIPDVFRTKSIVWKSVNRSNQDTINTLFELWDISQGNIETDRKIYEIKAE